MLALLLMSAMAAPLAPSDAFTLLDPGASPAMAPEAAKLDAKCKRGAMSLLRASPSELRKTVPQVGCVKPRFPKLAAAIDGHAGRCAASNQDACEGWLTLARAIVADTLLADGTAADFGRVICALAGQVTGDDIDAGLAKRAIDAANRLSAAQPESGPVQRLALAAWLSLPTTAVAEGESAFAALIPRVLQTNAEDPEVWGAFTVIAARAHQVEAAKQFTDALATGSQNTTHRATAFYLRGCLATQEGDLATATAAFRNAAKADPFDARYRSAASDTAAGTRVQCKIVMAPFGTAIKSGIVDPP